MPRLIVASTCALVAGLAGCSPPASQPAASAPVDAPAVVVSRDDYGVTATLRYAGGCEALLSRRPAPEQALRYRDECEPSLSASLHTLAALATALLGAGDLPAEITQLDAGRLVTTWPEIALRLALAARDAPGWDAARAWTDHGFANAFVRELANRQRLFAELDDLFRRRGRGVALSSVEKVLIGTPAQTPIAQGLSAHGVGETERLPFDAQLWFQLRPVTPGSD